MYHQRFLEQQELFPVPESVRNTQDIQDFEALYFHSIAFPDRYWANVASELLWEKPWEKIYADKIWFLNGQINITVNALDRHASGENRNKVALIATSEEKTEFLVTYDRLLRRVCQLANGLRALGVKKGDRIAIIMPPGPEAIGSMLAAARIGAIHVVLYPELGISPLRTRLEYTSPRVIICSDVLYKKGQIIPLKNKIDAVVENLDCVGTVLVHRRLEPKVSLTGKREKDLIDFLDPFPQWCDPEPTNADDPLFLLYTSGSGSTPRGIIHSHGSYAVAAYHFGKFLLGLKPSDILWTLADLSWIVGHTAMVYMPLLCGITSLTREGSLGYPDSSVFAKTIHRHGINVVLGTPRKWKEIRAAGDNASAGYDLSTLRFLLSVGSYLSPDLHRWLQQQILKEHGFVINMWMQTEVAAPALGTFPFFPAKTGTVGKPMPGVIADIVDEEGQSLQPGIGGYLVFRRPFPGIFSKVFHDTHTSRQLYWRNTPEVFWTGDLAVCDEEGYFTVFGRTDESIHIEGNRIHLAEIELLLYEHPSVKDVVALPVSQNHEEPQLIIVVEPTMQSSQNLENLKQILLERLEQNYGLSLSIELHFIPEIPKTKSGTPDRAALLKQFQ